MSRWHQQMVFKIAVAMAITAVSLLVAFAILFTGSWLLGGCAGVLGIACVGAGGLIGDNWP